MTLLEALYRYDRNWRENIASDPVEAGVEIGLLEPSALDGPEYAYEPLNFNDEG